MKKSLKRVLERLRAATNAKFRMPTPVRGGVEQAQRMQALHVRTIHVRG